MPDVVLACMPFTAIDKPSLGLGLLRSALEQGGIAAEVFYGQLWMAEKLGIEIYHTINQSPPEYLLGEWVFAGAAFPDFSSDRSAYFDLIFTNQFIRKLDSELPPGRNLADVLLHVRAMAPAFIDEVARAVLNTGPRIVGCSSNDAQHCASLALLRRIKELDPKVVTLMGGANCEAVMGRVTRLEFPWIDFVVSGEAEDLIGGLCRTILDEGSGIASGDLPYGVIGRANRERNPPPRAVVKDLDHGPVPHFDEYFETLQSRGLTDKVSPQLLIETSRGCWWNRCAFCSLNGCLTGYRSKAGTRAVEEIRFLAEKYGVTNFTLADNVLEMNYFNSLIPELAASGRSFHFFCEVRPSLSRVQVTKLIESGITEIQSGIESLHDSFLRSITKGGSALRNIQFMKYAREADMTLNWFFLWGAPGESDGWYVEMAEWLPWLAHLEPPLVWRVQFRRFSPYHARQADFGLNLAPSEAYSFVYPLNPEARSDLAQYFEDEHRPAVGVELETRPGLRAVMRWIFRWRHAWATTRPGLSPPPLLQAISRRDELIVQDTRPCAIASEFRLSGLKAAVYRACDRILSRRALVVILNRIFGLRVTRHEVDPVIRELQDLRILLELGGKFVSLATVQSTHEHGALRENDRLG